MGLSPFLFTPFKGQPACVPGALVNNALSPVTPHTKAEDQSMFSFGKMKEEDQLAASKRKAEQAQQDKDAARKARSAHAANLRDQRLAKEAADKKAAELASADKTTAKSKKPPRSNAA